MDDETSAVLGTVAQDGKVVVDSGRFKPVWDDGTKHEEASIEKMAGDDGWHLRVRGTTADGNCTAHWLPIEFTRSGDIELARDAEDAHTCRGNTCSSCSIERDPSTGTVRCTCNDMDLSHSCDHITTRLEDVIPKILPTYPNIWPLT